MFLLDGNAVILTGSLEAKAFVSVGFWVCRGLVEPAFAEAVQSLPHSTRGEALCATS